MPFATAKRGPTSKPIASFLVTITNQGHRMPMNNPATLCRTHLAAGFLLLGAALGAGTAEIQAQDFKVGSIEIEQPWSRATPPGARTGAGYLALSNSSSEADRLVSAASPLAEKVELHEMAIVNGIMNMKPVDSGIEIPAGGQAALAPGGYHLMLMGIKEPFKEGATVPVTLTFEKAGSVEVDLQVGSMGAKAPAQDHGHESAGQEEAHEQ